MSSFPGAPFALLSVTPRDNYATLRVRFGNDPKASDPGAADDGLNTSSYTLTGPSVIAITGAATVSSDPQAIDLTLAAPLITGTWTLAVAGIESVDSDPLEAPTSLDFEVSVLTTVEAVNPGATNDDAESIIRKHLSKALRGRFIDGLIAALAAGDRINWQNAKLAFDQLFKTSASGIYLDRKCADDGLVRPEAVGMSDDLFRRYAIKTTNAKLTPQVLLEIMEVFYGSDATRAHMTSGTSEPYALADGQELDLLADEKDVVKVVFRSADFAQIGKAKAVEVAAAITRHFRSLNLKGFATAFEDPETGEKMVRLYSSALGLAGSMRVRGGQAQSTLQFPDGLLTTVVAGAPSLGVQSGQSWTVTVPEAGLARFTLTGASTTDLNLVRAGDYVNIYGATVHEENRGSFPVTRVDVRYLGGVLTQFFEVEIDDPQAGSFTTQTTDDLLFFRAVKKSISGSRTVVVSQPEPGFLYVVLPATTLAVERTAKTGAYAQTRVPLKATALKRLPDGQVDVTFATAPGLQVGEYVLVDDVVPDSTAPSTSAGNGTSTTDAKPVSFLSSLADMPTFPRHNLEACLLANGDVFSVGGHLIDQSSGPPADLGQVGDAARFRVTGTTVLVDGSLRHDYEWVATASTAPVEFHRLSLLTDPDQSGRVLMAGGYDGAVTLADAHIYDPATNVWAATGDMGTARAKHVQVRLLDGRVLVAGGASDEDTSLASAEIFTPSASGGSWAATGSLGQARADAQAVRLSDGRVLVLGGRQLDVPAVFEPNATGQYGKLLASAEIFDPSTGTWSRTGDMAFARALHKAVLLPDDRVLVFGGRTAPSSNPGAEEFAPEAEMWDAQTGRWYPAGRAATGRQGHELVYLETRNQVVLLGGWNTTGFATKVEYFDPDAGRWSPGPVSMPVWRYAGAAVVTPQDGIWYGGGFSQDSSVFASSETANLFMPSSDVIAARGLNGMFRVTDVDGLTVRFQSDEHRFTASAVATITPATAVESAIPGPFIFDPDTGLAVTDTETTSAQRIDAGQQYRTLKVADATEFPDASGYLVLDFGTARQTGPVRYLGRLSTNELVLDYGFRFPVTVPSGCPVTLLVGKAPFVPEVPEDVGSFYLTASSAGRVAASKAIDDAVAAGIGIEKQVQYPGDRGLGGEGLPSEGAQKLSDKVTVWGGDNLDAEIDEARES